MAVYPVCPGVYPCCCCVLCALSSLLCEGISVLWEPPLQPLFWEGVPGEIVFFEFCFFLHVMIFDRPPSPPLTILCACVCAAVLFGVWRFGIWRHCVCMSSVVSGPSSPSNDALICVSTIHCCRSMIVRCFAQEHVPAKRQPARAELVVDERHRLKNSKT